MGDGGPVGIAHQEIHIDAGQVEHAEYAHVQVQVSKHAIHLGRRRAFQHQAMSLAGIWFEHAVANETETNAGNHRQLADAPGDVQGSGQHVGRGGPAAHDLEQAHGIGGAEKVQPYYILRASHGRRDGVHIQRRGVGRQDRARLAHLFQGAEHLLLDLQLLEDRLDHQVGLGQVRVVKGAEDQIHA
ncbi:hypothetical protein D9M70_532990 [compost metagenome]